MKTLNKTFDLHFSDDNNSSSKGFKMTLQDAMNYIINNNGTNNSYFSDYKSGTVSIVCNEDGETFYEEEIR